jgi:methionyl-tRNA formyltransferase
MDNTIKKYLLLSEKNWHDGLFLLLTETLPGEWVRINKKEEFTEEILARLQPDIIFIPHWSYFIPNAIFEQFECIVFHMTDLPFGRGGSPLQNLIVLGYKETLISALRVEEGLDAGDIYLKKKLPLHGKASEIFERSSLVVGEMIKEIILDKIKPAPQQGEPFFFKRRGRKDGEISLLTELEKVYDYIRMLDCEGYPNAFLETNHFRFEFYNAVFSDTDKSINANVRITKK